MKRKFFCMALMAFFLGACVLVIPPGQAVRKPSLTPAATPTTQGTPTALALATRVIPNPLETNIPLPGLPRSGRPEARYTRKSQSEHFTFYQDEGYQPVELKKWIEQAEGVYAYVSRRLNLDVEEKIGIAFQPPDPSACPARGAAAGTFIIIYADENTSEKQLLGVLAHELGHAIRSSAAAEFKPDSIALEEGMATWASGRYWTDWQGYASLDEMVKDYLRKSAYLPLYQYPNLEGSQPGSPIQGDCLNRRNILYTEYASFIDFLIREYGREKLDALFKTGSVERSETSRIIHPPDYPAVYGLSLNQLEAQWLASLQQRLTYN